jgi:hypothetical protein
VLKDDVKRRRRRVRKSAAPRTAALFHLEAHKEKTSQFESVILYEIKTSSSGL